MGQSRRAEHQCEAERNGRDGVAHEAAGTQDRGALRLDLDGVRDEGIRVETVMPKHAKRHDGSADEQQTGLDHLNPGRGFHAAVGHVDDHQNADDDDGIAVVEAEEQLINCPAPTIWAMR